MAKIPFGILGPFSGTVGHVIGRSWKGKAVMTGLRKASKRDKHPTAGQKAQRTKFGFTSKFMKGLAPLVKKSFRELAIGKTEFQCALSYNIYNAVSGKAPDFTLHYELVAVGRGTLPNAVLPEVKTGEATGDILFIWADNSGIGGAAATDTAFVVVYNPADRTWLYKKEPDAKRSDGAAALRLPHLAGKTVHTWLTFVSEAGRAADSIYTGKLLVK